MPQWPISPGEGHGGLTSNVDSLRVTSQAVWIMSDNICRLEDSLNGASLDVELVIAEAVPPLLRRKVPVCHCSIAQVSSYEHIDTADNVPHHTVANDYDLLES